MSSSEVYYAVVFSCFWVFTTPSKTPLTPCLGSLLTTSSPGLPQGDGSHAPTRQGLVLQRPTPKQLQLPWVFGGEALGAAHNRSSTSSSMCFWVGTGMFWCWTTTSRLFNPPSCSCIFLGIFRTSRCVSINISSCSFAQTHSSIDRFRKRLWISNKL